MGHALGVRALNTKRTVLIAVTPSVRDSSKPSPAALAAAGICFGLCIVAVLFGIAVIIYGKQMFGV